MKSKNYSYLKMAVWQLLFKDRVFFPINGAYFYKLYGILIGHEANILFLAPKVSNKEEILEAIYQNTLIKDAKRITR
jgi:hypothetical protein